MKPLDALYKFPSRKMLRTVITRITRRHVRSMCYVPLYNGKKVVQVTHEIQCRHCNDKLRSKHAHDFKMCWCGKVGIDGGIHSGRIIGDEEDYEDLSQWRTISPPYEQVPTKMLK